MKTIIRINFIGVTNKVKIERTAIHKQMYSRDMFDLSIELFYLRLYMNKAKITLKQTYYSVIQIKVHVKYIYNISYGNTDSTA